MVANSIQYGLRFFVSVILCLNLIGCDSGASTTSTIAPTLAPAASPVALTPSAPSVAATSVPTVLPPPTPVPATPAAARTATLPPTTAPAPAADQTATEMRAIAQASFDAYPWRLNQSALLKSSNYTITTLVEATGRGRFHAVQNSPLGNVVTTIDLVLITPTLYAKVTNYPPDQLQSTGLT